MALHVHRYFWEDPNSEMVPPNLPIKITSYVFPSVVIICGSTATAVKRDDKSPEKGNVAITLPSE